MGIRQGIFTVPKKQFKLKRCSKRKVKLQRVQSIALYKLSCFFDISNLPIEFNNFSSKLHFFFIARSSHRTWSTKKGILKSVLFFNNKTLY